MDFTSFTIETLEGISSIATTVMSTIVAGVALLFSYRQNAGWKPIALVVRQGMSGVGGTRACEFDVNIEVWNRRRYPVVLRGITVNVDGFNLQSRERLAADEPYIRGNCFLQKISIAVNPGEQFQRKLVFGFENESLDAMRPFFDIEIQYFDPQAGRQRKLRIRHKHFYPGLGWKVNETKRQKMRESYS